MKFARYLNSHAIDEWRKAYINYRALKKQIGRAEDELLRVDEGYTPATDRPASPHDPTRGTVAPEEHAEFIRDRQYRPGDAAGAHHAGGGALEEPDLERGRSDEDEDEQNDATLASSARHPPRRENGQSGSRAPSVNNKRPVSPLPSPDHSSSLGDPLSDDTQHTGRPLVQAARKPATSPQGDRHTDLSHGSTSPIKRLSSQPTRLDQRRRWREGFSPNMDLPELFEHMTPQCRRFFTLLDRELERVTGFYADREEEAVRRFQQLRAQWDELANHKKEFQAFRERELHPPAFVSSLFPKRTHVPHLPGTHIVRRTLAQRSKAVEDEDDGVANEARRKRVSVNVNGDARAEHSNGESDDADDEGIEQRAKFRHRRPEEYTNARSKLKLATFEYYRSLGMLKSYRVLNRTGFAKALKKFEKATAIPCSTKYSEKVEAANFASSSTLDDLIRDTENAFAEVFERGDRKKALERLRDFGEKKRHHFSTWRAGLLMGAALPLMIEGLVLSFKAHTRREIPYWPALLQLFGACYLPIFFALAFFLNLAAWNYSRINYVLIFELDVRNRMDYHQYLELPATLFFILSLFFWAAFSNFWPDEIHPSAYPLAWIVVTVLIMFNPFPVLYPAARWWLLRSFCRMISSGLVAVEFRDFLLGDEMNSLYYSYYNLGLLYCAYNKRWPDDTFSVCSTNSTWTTPILSCLPPFWRFGQSIRRYFDSDGLYLHLLNAGKYSATMAYFFAYYGWRIHKSRTGEDEAWRLAVFILFATINTLYTSSWDLLMDWSLGNRNVKKKSHYLLRNELGFFKDTPWMYYIASVANVVLRFSWVIYLAPHPSVPVQGYILALVEAARRIMWNTLRVEAEHIGNRDGFRVTRDVTLPYVSANSPEASGNTSLADDDSEPLGPRQRFFAFFHSLHDSVLDNLRPLRDALGGPGGIVPLGQRVDSSQREQREVEAQERAEDAEEAAEVDEEEQARQRDYEKRLKKADRRRSRKKRGAAPMPGPDDSSSPSSSHTDETGAEEDEAERVKAEAAVKSSRKSAGQESSPSSPLRESAEGDPGEGRLDDEAGRIRQEIISDDEGDDRALQEGMAEVERITDVADAQGIKR
ncbi:Syg1p [Rhodotorula paludigena]|uniref:Syg1p n=1 Tax=Rhodotorula paludigena TaxID=86838 RepID=UPI00317D861C